MIVDERVDLQACQSIVQGQADPLKSQFRLSYGMILNLMRVQTTEPELVIKQSLCQYQFEKDLPEIEAQIASLEKEKDSIETSDRSDVTNFFRMCTLRDELQAQLATHIFQPAVVLPFLQPGRVAYVRNGEDDYGWGVVINFRRRFSPDGYMVDVLLPIGALEQEGPFVIPKPYSSSAAISTPGSLSLVSPATSSTSSSNKSQPSSTLVKAPADRAAPLLPTPPQFQCQVVAVMLSLLTRISSIRMYVPRDLRDSTSRNHLYSGVEQLKQEFPSGFPLLDPLVDLKLTSDAVRSLAERISSLTTRIDASPVSRMDVPERLKLFAMYERRLNVEVRLGALRQRAKQSQMTQFVDELKLRTRVLRRLGYVDDNGVRSKGRVACEIEAVDEVVDTHFFFLGFSTFFSGLFVFSL